MNEVYIISVYDYNKKFWHRNVLLHTEFSLLVIVKAVNQVIAAKNTSRENQKDNRAISMRNEC